MLGRWGSVKPSGLCRCIACLAFNVRQHYTTTLLHYHITAPLKFPHPNVPVTHFIRVVLQRDRPGRVRRVFVQADVGRRAFNFPVVLYEHAVVEDGKISGPKHHPVVVEDRSGEDDVVTVPLAHGYGGVNQRRVLLVDRSGLAVGVGIASVGFEYLDLIAFLKEYTAIAALLAFLAGLLRAAPFEVQLNVFKVAAGLDESAAGLNGHDAVFDRPFYRTFVFHHYPFAGFSVFTEQYDCVGGRGCRYYLGLHFRGDGLVELRCFRVRDLGANAGAEEG